jgi:GDP-D-mannose dehydratase
MKTALICGVPGQDGAYLADLNWRDHVQLDENLQRPSEIICSKGDARKASADLGWKSTHALPDVRMMVQAELATTAGQAEGASLCHERRLGVAT